MPWVEFESTISAGERPYTYASDRAATGTGFSSHYKHQTKNIKLTSQRWNSILMHEKRKAK